MNKKLLLVSSALLLSASAAFAQKQVKGRVADSSGHPLEGAVIRIPGTKVIVYSDAQGRFVIPTAPAKGKKITISYIGMDTKTVEPSEDMNVVLEGNNELGDVIVVAYGTAKKGSYTGSAAVVKADALENRLVSDVTKSLSGTISGVQGTSANGQPGTSAKIHIRGFGSINAGMDPLYIVDGAPYSGDISSINPQDIESISVQKDAASAALYGARGANGVIIITTKKGREGDAKISADARWGVNSRMIDNYNVMTTPKEYIEKLYQGFYNEGRYTLGYATDAAHTYGNSKLTKLGGYPIYTLPTGELLVGTNGLLNPNATLGYNDGKNFITPDDWKKETFSKGLRQEYNINIGGASDRFNYYFSAGYLNDEGVIPHSAFKRISTRANIEYQVRNWLKVGTNLSYTNSNSRYPTLQDVSNSSSNAFAVALSIAPIYPVYVRDAQGNILRDSYSGKPIYDYGNAEQTAYTRNFFTIANPVGDLVYDKKEYLVDLFSGSWYATITPIEGLALTARLSATVDNTRYHAAGSNKYGQERARGGSVTQRHSRFSEFNQQYLANYKRSFGAHNFDFLLGYESYDHRSESLRGTATNLYRSGVWAINNAIDNRYAEGSGSEYSTRGIIFRTNYDYDSRFFGSFSFRRDASSRFHPDNRWGSFWSLSGAWEMKREHFLEAQDWINSLKVKASFGQQGNDAIGNFFAYTDQYTVTGTNGIFSDGALAYKGNPNLTWEKTNSFNVGADFVLWNGLLSGTVEYFSRQTSDMLYNRPVALSNGYISIPENVGSMRNSGLELDLQSKLINTEDLQWSVNWNGTLLKNKIIKLSSRLPLGPDSTHRQLIEGARIYREGESMYNIYLVKYAGVDQATGLALYWAYDKDKKKEYATADWNVAYETNRKATGDVLPTIYGGFGTTLKFKNFDLSLTCGYQLGGKVLDYAYQDFMHGGSSNDVGRNWHKDIARSWTPTNTVTNVPRVNASDKFTNSSSDRWLISSNYLSLNNITFGYTLPLNLTRSMGIESVRVYAAADNLAILTARKGLDPRQGFLTSSNTSYSALRAISFGIKLGL